MCEVNDDAIDRPIGGSLNRDVLATAHPDGGGGGECTVEGTFEAIKKDSFGLQTRVGHVST